MAIEKKNSGNNFYKGSKTVDKKKKSERFGTEQKYTKSKTESTYGGKEKKVNTALQKDMNSKSNEKRFSDNELKDRGFKEKGFKEKGFEEKGIKNKEFKEKSFKENGYKDRKQSGSNFRDNKESYQGKRQGEQQGNKKPTGDFKSSSKNTKCSVKSKCGGCQLLHLDYAKQLKEKQKKAEELLGQYGKVEPIIGMKNPDHYRNKVHAVFDHDGKGNAISGVYEAGTHNVIPIDSCIIENEKADEIIVSIRGLLKSFKIKTYDEDTGYGLLRHVLIRTGHKSGQIMVVLVLGSPIMPSKNNFVKALRKLHPEISTIIVNVNNKKTSMVLGDKEQVIYGKGYIEDTLCEKVFHISPKSFYQVNPVQTEVLYKKAIELGGLTGKETIIDAYCGIGTIGIIASDSAKKVIGVELNKDAVKDANSNAKRNLVTNIDFYNKDAGEFMSQMAAQEQKADVVFMDPPRAGSDEKFLTSLCTLAPERVVYISCNPVTLARDLEFLVKNGYKVKRMIPVDMFPYTEHVETCVLLTR